MASWKDFEDDIIRLHYPAHGALGCKPFLNRNQVQISRRASQIAVRKDKKPARNRMLAVRTFTMPEHCHPMVKQLFTKLRTEKMSLREAARRAGLKDATVHQWGRRNPSLVNFIAVANTVGLDLCFKELEP